MVFGGFGGKNLDIGMRFVGMLGPVVQNMSTILSDNEILAHRT